MYKRQGWKIGYRRHSPLNHLVQMCEERARARIGSAAFWPKYGNLVPFDGELGQDRHQFAPHDIGCCHKARADPEFRLQRREYMKISLLHEFSQSSGEFLKERPWIGHPLSYRFSLENGAPCRRGFELSLSGFGAMESRTQLHFVRFS